MYATSEQVSKLNAVLHRVLESPRSNFYREKYLHEGFDAPRDIRSAKDVSRVPRLTRSELAAVSPLDRLYTDLGEVSHVLYTSGTSGEAPILIFRQPLRSRYGIPGERPLILSVNNHIDVWYADAPRLAAEPHPPPIIQYAASAALTARLAERYGVDALVGPPVKLQWLREHLSPEARQRINAVFTYGERFTDGVVQSIRAAFPNAAISIRFGSTELGLFGYQCPALQFRSAGCYHVRPDDHLLEITDPDSGSWRESGEEGEIVVTELFESPHQFIRYRTGDAGRMVNPEPCACGAPFTFEVTGRIAYDIIKVAGGMLRSDEIERVLGEIPETRGADFRAVIRGGEKPVLVIHIAAATPGTPHPAISQNVRSEIARRLFLTPTKTLADFLAEGRFSGFEIQFASGFPPSGKAQRLRHES